MARIPLIEDLTTGILPSGSNILVEFAGASQWVNACLAMAAGWLKQGQKVTYNTFLRSPDDVRSKLKRAGLDAETLEADDKLRIWDWYTATLGKKSAEKYAYDSLKVPDLSIRFAKVEPSYQLAGWIRICDSMSTLGRFNDEKSWVEFLLTRAFPTTKFAGKTTTLIGVQKDVYSNSAYEQLEAVADGIIDFRVEEFGGEWRNFISIRSMFDVSYDSRSHQFKIDENLRITLNK